MKEQPKWQKGKILFTSKSYPHTQGKLIWIKCGPRTGETMRFRTPDGLVGTSSGDLETNLEVWGRYTEYRKTYLPRSAVELLPDFAFDDVPLVPFTVWSAPDWQGV